MNDELDVNGERLADLTDFNDSPIFDPELINFLEQKGVTTMFLENTRRYRASARFKTRPYETKSYFIKFISQAFMFYETPQGRDYWLALTLKHGEYDGTEIVPSLDSTTYY